MNSQPIREKHHEGDVTDPGVAFAVQAARALQASGNAAGSDGVLLDAERRALQLGSAALAALADARAEFGSREAAARLLALAAEHARREGDAGRAVELCLRASRCGTIAQGLHRTWGVALLAGGDPDGARGHLERWCEEEPDSVEALLWTLEASWRQRPTTEIGPLLERLAQRLDAAGPTASGSELCDRVRSYLRARGAAVGDPALAPFWEARDFPCALLDGRGASAGADPRRRVLVVEEARCSARLLSRILERWNLEVITMPAEDGAGLDLSDPVDLAIVPLPGDVEAAAARLERIRSHPGLAHMPVLGVVTLEGSSLDYARLRELGVMGVVDRAATPEHVAFRIGQAAALRGDEACRRVRVPVGFAVELELEGRVTEERAENLSYGGIRIQSRRALEPNTDVVLRFRLSETSPEPIRAEGRVIHCQPRPAADDTHSVGIFFRSLEPRHRELVEAEVVRLFGGGAPADEPARASSPSV